ncbi:hypothetical protein QF042_004454 [Pedobacter sp. W3I1]|uniref:hypothetical protein n=1 Tax=Pedobacter sp. W3I1 TaxID=3042291 RepID=UPI00277EBE4B|nr:hypothetical protein [Pedobacter sp. W3I1]MDQ0640889.1 hypothetical protein [Pedobacter sp. W3I1]
MRIIKLLIFLCIFFFAEQNVFGQQGCYVSAENTIYITDANVNYTYYFLFIPIAGPYRVYSNPYSTVGPSCPRAQLGANTGVSCWKTPTSSLTLGTVYNYTLLTPPASCPIDNLTIFMIVFSAVGGFLIIKRTVLYQ